MIFRLILITFIFFSLNACALRTENDAIYGEYSLMLEGVENILIISPNGTYTQKQNLNGEMTTTNDGVWKDYIPNDDDIRFSLIGFQFPSKESSGEWHAQLGRTWTKLSLCYFNDRDVTECYVKKKSIVSQERKF